MPELDPEVLKKLADWEPNGLPVSSMYLDVDGRRAPRRQDYIHRAEELARRIRERATGLPREACRSVERDAERMIDHLEHEFDRGPTRGLALFSCAGAGLWEEIRVPRPVRDRGAVGEAPYILPLEAAIEVSRTIATVLVDRTRGRLFLTHLGRIEERGEIADEVPGRHKQGEWAQARYQRHVDDHAAKHVRRVADAVLELYRESEFDHLTLAGPQEAVAELESLLHDYCRQRIAARWVLPMTTAPAEILERTLDLEEELETERERSVLERTRAEAAAGRAAVLGLEPVLAALNEGRVQTLLVPLGRQDSGHRCPACGWLSLSDGECPRCGRELEAVVDVLEAALALAYRQRSGIEAVSYSRVDGSGDVGALLRY